MDGMIFLPQFKDFAMAKKPTYEELEKMVRELQEERVNREQAERALREAREYAENIVATVREPLVVLDGELRVISANRSFYRVFAMKPEETQGRFVYDLGNRQWDIPRLRELLEKIVPRKSALDDFEMVHDFPALGRRIMLLNARRIPREASKDQLILLAIEDVTERVRAEEALRQSADQLKFFAYSVMHDLKSPAVGIHGLTKLLTRQYGEILGEKGKNYCNQVLRAAENLAALVEKINVYIAAKENPLNAEKIEINEMLETIKDEFSTQLNTRKIGWYEDNIPAEIKADRLSILRVLRNLVENTLKYGGEELTKISVGYHESEELHIFSVSDDGVGIRSKDFEKIFGLFQRNETSKGTEGTGMGLAIVKEIAERHSGKVWAEPGADKGVTFYISISKTLL